MKSLAVAVLLTLFVPPAWAQETTALDQAVALEISPSPLTLQVGQKAKLNAIVKDKDGNVVPAPVLYISRSRRNVGVEANGEVTAFRPGEFVILAMVPRDPNADPRNANQEGLRFEVPVTIPLPPVERIDLSVPARLYTGTSVRVLSEVYDSSKTLRRDVRVSISSSNPQIASTDRFNHVSAIAPGTIALTAVAENMRENLTINVVPNPLRSFELTPSRSEARTGDVIKFNAVAKDERGTAITDMPVVFGVHAHRVNANPGAASTAQIDETGRFVAEEPGLYTVVASAAGRAQSVTVEIKRRDIQQRIELVGQGPVRDRHTSDFWIWQGVDGRDYAITGTWGADGHAYFWDVTDPKNMKLVDQVRVDARTVNDVKISEDGRIAVISREGASNRRNGIVILDVSNPSEVKVLSRFDDGLTGGVHNVYIYKNHVYAVNAGRKYDVINISEPKLPYRAGVYELDTPGHSIHDVWIDDGIAYSSNWQDGVHVVDVGNGVAGGSPDKPVLIGKYADPKGHNHAAFPFKDKQTGKSYVIMGDEIFPYDARPGEPEMAAGYLHFVDFTDPKNPKEVARYEVPEAGTHNFWVEDEKLYVAYYNGGVRVVDVSGDLMGDLYKQGREIAFYKPADPNGHIKNAPMVWSAMPYKGLIWLSDHNSGLWALKLVPREQEGSGGR